MLATDDLSQNWSVGQGIHLAKELLGSKIEIDLNRSIYNIGGRGQKFDVILCLGVYYHLHDPYYAFSQLRHCCHEDTVVLIEGNIANHLPALTARCKFGDQANEFCPELAYLVQLLRATYLEPVTIDGLESAGPVPTPTFTTPAASAVRLNRRWRLQMIRAAIGGKWDEIRKLIAAVDPPPDLESCTRVLFKCAPFRGPNSIHAYSPPFGLEVYDPRFHSTNSE